MLSVLKRTKSNRPLEPGAFGRFYLQELINNGGMAEIWLATDELHKPYALRVMNDESFFHFGERRRFIRGCETLARISNHENIIRYIEHGKVENRLYCLMEYIEAENLKVLYARQDPVLVENVAQIIIDMAVSLEHMHNCGFMHLDFKPENVLVSRNAKVRLIDFDLAQPIPQKPAKLSKSNPGTPAYMAPEQLQGQPISHSVDIFAFGVSAYELLTSQKPFPGETPGEILRRQLDRTDFAEPRRYNPDIPAALERTIIRCLEIEPAKRHPFMGVLVRELKEALYLR